LVKQSIVWLYLLTGKTIDSMVTVILLYFSCRCWIVANRQESTVEVFNVDYGNTAVVNKKDTSLTLPDIWDLQPAVRPFRATGKLCSQLFLV
jgi:hypothetical protein